LGGIVAEGFLVTHDRLSVWAWRGFGLETDLLLEEEEKEQWRSIHGVGGDCRNNECWQALVGGRGDRQLDPAGVGNGATDDLLNLAEGEVNVLTAGFWTRHNGIRDLLYDYLTSHGIPTQKETPIDGAERSADLFLLRSWHGGRATCVDVTVVHALPDTIYGGTGVSAQAVQDAKQDKRSRYRALFHRHPDLDFIPVAFDHLGCPGPADKLPRPSSFNFISQGQECID